MKLSPLQKGVGLMVLAWIFFAIMSALAKHSHQHVPAGVALFFQNFGALCFLSLTFFRKGKRYSIPPTWPWLVARALVGAFSFFCLFWSLGHIPLTDGAVLNNTAPLFVPLVMQIILKKRSSLRVWMSALVGFLGVLLILKPTGEIFQMAAFGALVSGIGSAFVMVIIRRISSEDPQLIILVYLTLGSLCAFFLAAPHLTSIPLAALPTLLGIGATFGAGQFVFTRCFRYAEPPVLAPFSYTLVAISALIDWLVWNHAPNLLSALGILLVVTGGVFTILASRSEPRQEPI
ncbi:MAG: DMT family transporter [Verrucomicrobia bacterium]|nr:DMT family transporter [Verrucomicrobiota bacterium]